MNLKSKIVEWGARAAVRFPRPFWMVFRTWEWTRQNWREATPGERAWRGAALGLVVATIIVVADAMLYRALLPHPTFDRVVSALRGGRNAALGGVALVGLASVVGRMPWRYKLALGACGGILASQFPFSMDERGLVWGLLAFSAAGAGLAAIFICPTCYGYAQSRRNLPKCRSYQHIPVFDACRDNGVPVILPGDFDIATL